MCGSRAWICDQPEPPYGQVPGRGHQRLVLPTDHQLAISSAEVIHIKPLADVTEADWDRTLDVSLKGALLTSQAAAPHIIAAGTCGRIVAISSGVGNRSFSWIQAYSASK